MLRAPKREYEVSEEGRTEAPSVPRPSITGQGPSRYFLRRWWDLHLCRTAKRHRFTTGGALCW